MPDISISYKGNTIATMDATGTKTLLTAGKYCEDDIAIDYVKPSGGGVDKKIVTISAGYFNADGTIHYAGSSTQEKYTSKISVSEGDIILFKWHNDVSQVLWAVYGTYDTNDTWIARTQMVNADRTDYMYIFTIPSGVSAVAFAYRTYGTADAAEYGIVLPV